MERRHHRDREGLLESFLMGAAIASEDVRSELNPENLTTDAILEVQDPSSGVQRLDEWLSKTLGIERQDGEKVIDAALRQLAANAELRDMERHGRGWEALQLRFIEACERRRKAKP